MMAVWYENLAEFGTAWPHMSGCRNFSCKYIARIHNHYEYLVCTNFEIWRHLSSRAQICRSTLFTTAHGDMK